MAFLASILLSDEDKLEILRRLDQFRDWYSLDDQRYCLNCGKLITGRQIQVVGGTRGSGPLRLVCPTPRCPAIAMDWVLPTADVLEKCAGMPSTLETARRVAEDNFRERKPTFRKSLRKLASHFRRPI
jgi:hypothetical protein